MSGETMSVLLVGAAGILLGIWWLRRQDASQAVGQLYGTQQLGYSLWGQVPYATLPGPPTTWALLNR